MGVAVVEAPKGAGGAATVVADENSARDIEPVEEVRVRRDHVLERCGKPPVITSANRFPSQRGSDNGCFRRPATNARIYILKMVLISAASIRPTVVLAKSPVAVEERTKRQRRRNCRESASWYWSVVCPSHNAMMPVESLLCTVRPGWLHKIGRVRVS